MISDTFSHVTNWVFDLDHTLYPPEMRLFDQIEAKMTSYVMRELGLSQSEADTLRANYWRDHGTTLAGLMRNHDIDPEPYLREVHDISFHPLTADTDLAAAIKALPGRKIIYTNGTAPYAQKVAEARGLSGCFDAIYGIEHAGFLPKPERAAFETVFGLDNTPIKTAAMFEDDHRNLQAPFEMGLKTIFVAPEPRHESYIHHHTADLTQTLQQIT